MTVKPRQSAGNWFVHPDPIIMRALNEVFQLTQRQNFTLKNTDERLFLKEIGAKIPDGSLGTLERVLVGDRFATRLWVKGKDFSFFNQPPPIRDGEIKCMSLTVNDNEGGSNEGCRLSKSGGGASSVVIRRTNPDVGSDSAMKVGLFGTAGAIDLVELEIPAAGTGNYILTDNGATLDNAGVFNSVSSERAKEAFENFTDSQILGKIKDVPSMRWKYRREHDKRERRPKYFGPMAEKFNAVFGVGNSPGTISSLSVSGVCLAGVGAAARKIEQLETKVVDLESRLLRLEAT